MGRREVSTEDIGWRAVEQVDSWLDCRERAYRKKRNQHWLKGYPWTPDSTGISVTHSGMEGKILRKNGNHIFNIFASKKIGKDIVIIKR